jgi:hypothetical protein
VYGTYVLYSGAVLPESLEWVVVGTDDAVYAWDSVHPLRPLPLSVVSESAAERQVDWVMHEDHSLQ